MATWTFSSSTVKPTVISRYRQSSARYKPDLTIKALIREGAFTSAPASSLAAVSVVISVMKLVLSWLEGFISMICVGAELDMVTAELMSRHNS